MQYVLSRWTVTWVQDNSNINSRHLSASLWYMVVYSHLCNLGAMLRNSYLWVPGIVFVYLEMSQLRILSEGCEQLCGLVLGGLLPPVLASDWRMIKRVVGVGSWTCAPVASVHSSVTTFSTLYLLNIKLLHYNLHSVNCFLLHCTVWWILIHVHSGDHSHHQNRAFSSPSKVPSCPLKVPFSPNPGLRKPLTHFLSL